MNTAKAYGLVSRMTLQAKLLIATPLTILAIRKLDNRFSKIDPNEYYLSYSGGEDSELLRQYIVFRDLPIKIVAVNTYREHSEIRRRIYKYSDVVLYPKHTFEWIYENYGAPCFSKQQDEYIKRYQRGSRSENTMRAINGGENSKFQLNKVAKRLTLSGELHDVSGECCTYTKKKPMKDFEKEFGLKPIIGIVAGESATRDAKYSSCLSKDGKFTPLHDFSRQLIEALRKFFGMKKPKVYERIDRTGCIGCPYGRNIEAELSIVTPAQKRYAIKSFKASYDVKGVNYKDTQMNIFDYVEDKG